MHFFYPSIMHLFRLSIVIIAIHLVNHLGCAITGNSAATRFYPVDDITVNCGSFGNSTALDGQEWVGDVGFTGKSTTSRAVHRYISADPVPYLTARVSRSQFTYEFQVRPGQKFIRLHFHPSKYVGFQRSKAFFSVKAGPYTLLSNFSASLTADALGVKFFSREFCVNVDDQYQALSITFTPSLSTSSEDVYAFVNGIEIVPMPTGLYYTPDDDSGAPVVGNQYRRLYVDNLTALEMVYRLNIGGRSILSVEDLGMFRAWSEDRNYLLESGIASVRRSMMIRYTNIPIYVAPLKVYQTAWSMGSETQENKMYNLTWKLPVNLGFRYLVRLHFCELESGITEVGQREFSIFINNQIAETSADVIKWSGGNGVAVYRDYMLGMEGDRLDRKRDIVVALKPKPKNSGTKQSDPILNGIEVFKLSNHDNNLAGPNPLPISFISTSWISKLRKVVLAFGSGNVIAAFVVVMLTLVNIIVYQLNCWVANSCEDNKSSPAEEEFCRRFSFVEIQQATNNFNEAFVIGNGGFGKVYKGIIDRGARTVAIKRLKLESNQGASEFWMEIETLSTFQHVHLVSLIGYCDEGHEMILVYEHMAQGSLSDHLYKIHRRGNRDGNSLLLWEQRLRICIGAARGLDYLHTGKGTRHGLIHRDVKSSNILLDENWVAKISDFGLSKMEAANLSRTHISTAVKGTFGYLDPKYFMTHRLTRKSDVYAFGVVLLEALCGRPAVDISLVEEQHSLALWAESCIMEGALDQIVDASVKDQISLRSLKEFADISMKCICNHLSKRPTMAEVVAGLEHLLEQEGRAYSDSENDKAGSFSALSDDPYPGGQILPTPNLRIFSFSELKVATRNFRNDTVLGEGGFGKVYKGWLEEKATSKNTSSGSVIAVKKLNSESLQGFQEWQVNYLSHYLPCSTIR